MQKFPHPTVHSVFFLHPRRARWVGCSRCWSELQPRSPYCTRAVHCGWLDHNCTGVLGQGFTQSKNVEASCGNCGSLVVTRLGSPLLVRQQLQPRRLHHKNASVVLDKHCNSVAATLQNKQVTITFSKITGFMSSTRGAFCKRGLQPQQQLECVAYTHAPISSRRGCRSLHSQRCNKPPHASFHCSLSSGTSSITCLPCQCRQRLGHSMAIAAASGGNSSSSTADDSNSSGSSSGVLGLFQKWNEDTRNLREQLQSLGLAGVVAYGLFNTLYYTATFLVVWFNIANVPAGLGVQAAMRKAAEVLALVWAGSQVTKLARAGAALAFAPVVDRCLAWAVEKLKLRNKQQAFVVVVVACLALAVAVFGAVVAMHA